MSVYANEIGFAAGSLIATQINASGVITPVRFGILQDVQLDFSADLKELYGQNRYAIALAPGKTKVEVKAKFAALSGTMFNQLYFGGTTSATQILFADAELGTIPASTTYTVTVANSASWLADQGVYYVATGQPLTKVSALTAAGQYTVASGVYTFDLADAGAQVFISYTYSSTSGIQVPISNVKMGVGPSFSIVLSQAFDGRQGNTVLYVCQSSKLSLPSKQDDFMIAELDFMVAANLAGQIGTMNMAM